jgi:hypothetical protein
MTETIEQQSTELAQPRVRVKKYGWRKPKGAYLSPLSMLYEAGSLVHWKNTSREEWQRFAEWVKAKGTEMNLGRKRRKHRRKPNGRDHFYLDAVAFAREKWGDRTRWKDAMAILRNGVGEDKL